MKKHFVEFQYPGITGIIFSETIVKEIESWDVQTAVDIEKNIKATIKSYGFRFVTREINDSELDSRVTKISGTYYFQGEILSLQDVVDRKNPKDSILISNMKNNDYSHVININGAYMPFDPSKDFLVGNSFSLISSEQDLISSEQERKKAFSRLSRSFKA